MRFPTAIALSIFGVTVACVLFLAKHRSASPDAAEGAGSRAALEGAPGNPGPVNTGRGGTTEGMRAHESMALVQPDLAVTSSVQRIMAEASPGARTLFEEGLSLMHSGKFSEARETFQELIKTHPEDKAKALASWAIGLAYYQEGGTPNLHQAANQFISFRDSYSSDKDLDEFVRAAMIDIPVILMDLVHYGPSQIERDSAAALAVKTLTAFLDKWPDSPQAPAARASLKEVSDYLSRAK
ncbi:MAG: tetratricopeptide repeat protein [Acidobacteriia bacterium]|nr:tetratricopeptide repeat protein [Terriglobia bacterium]